MITSRIIYICVVFVTPWFFRRACCPVRDTQEKKQRQGSRTHKLDAALTQHTMLQWALPAWVLFYTRRYRWLCGYLTVFAAYLIRRYRHKWHYTTELQQLLTTTTIEVRESASGDGGNGERHHHHGHDHHHRSITQSTVGSTASMRSLPLASTDQYGRRIIVGFRGAGTYAYYYVGACEVLQSMLKHSSLSRFAFEGISSGALVATLMALNWDIVQVFEQFEDMVDKQRTQLRSKWWGLGRFLYPWQEATARVQVVEQYMRNRLTDEQVRALNGRLTIAVYDLWRAQPVANSQWRSVNHLMSWLLASMSIPFVTGSPRWIFTDVASTEDAHALAPLLVSQQQQQQPQSQQGEGVSTVPSATTPSDTATAATATATACVRAKSDTTGDSKTPHVTPVTAHTDAVTSGSPSSLTLQSPSTAAPVPGTAPGWVDAWIPSSLAAGKKRKRKVKKWHWAMDVLNWDTLAWRKSASVKRINIGVLDASCTIHPDVPLPLFLAITRQPPAMRSFLRERGRLNMRFYLDSHRELFAAHWLYPNHMLPSTSSSALLPTSSATQQSTSAQPIPRSRGNCRRATLERRSRSAQANKCEGRTHTRLTRVSSRLREFSCSSPDVLMTYQDGGHGFQTAESESDAEGDSDRAPSPMTPGNLNDTTTSCCRSHSTSVENIETSNLCSLQTTRTTQKPLNCR